MQGTYYTDNLNMQTKSQPNAVRMAKKEKQHLIVCNLSDGLWVVTSLRLIGHIEMVFNLINGMVHIHFWFKYFNIGRRLEI